MKLTQSERESIGIVDYVDNKATMSADELKSIRKTLGLTQSGLGDLLHVTHHWINRCENDKGKLTFGHIFSLRLLMDLSEGKRQKWINIPKRKNRTREEVDAAIEDAVFMGDKKQIAYFKKNGYEV
ncbi:hypothetical protein KAU11_09685 [Candidatus Babeliales bacterium]|nr:hypothetical protein [Candidatus Babeliales bacterium]